ncbi:MAG: T9SS type A sorting domain-containing protein, partial [Bacteroidota bacterium]
SMFALKMDASGNILWLADLQASKAGVSRHMVVDSLGNFYNSGLFIGIADFDPGPNQHILTSSQNGDYLSGYIRKLDPQGNLLWVKQMDGDFRNSLEMAYLKLDNEGALYLGGSSRGEVDIDPSPNIELIGFADTTAAYMSKFSSEGDFIWAESFLTISLYGEIIDVAFDRDNNIFSTGNYTYPFDLDPGPGTFTLSANGAVPDFYLAKFKQDGCAALFIQLDSITDVDCDNLGYISLHAEGASGPVNYQWNTTPPSTDSFLVLSRGGFYEIQISDSSGCEKKANYLIQGPQNDTTTDVRVNIFTDAARPGFPFCAWIDASNQSCIPISGELRIVLDSLLILDNANPDTTRGDTLIWYVNNLNYDSSGLMEKIETAVSLQAMIGQEVCVYTALVASMGNMDTLLYKGNLCTDIINGFDPNDMLVSPEGECEEGFILNEQPLTYTIRFQNTGNAEAINIFLLDTLDTDLDPGSMRILGQSHEPMITELIDDRILKFSFDNINLPDNTSNEPQSHGYVIYEILPKANRTVGSEIENRAGIYFDFNEAIVTNTVRNTITDEIPSYDLGISQRGGSLIADQAADPGISFQWVDCTNGNREIPGATSQSFSPEENGSYLVRIREGGCEALSECISLNTVNLEGELLTALQVYPNPVSDKVHIELGETFFDIAISLYHANGQLISRQKIPATDQFSLKLPEQSGIYFLKIEADDKRGQLKLLKR